MTAIKTIETMNHNNQAMGYLDAMNLVGKLVPSTGHPVEAEVLDRIYQILEKDYAKRFKIGAS